MEFKIFPDKRSLAASLAGRIAGLLAEAIRANGMASLAVSGGSTPVDLFEALSEMDISWEHVVITLVDERWVGLEDPDSNERLVKRHLLKGMAAAARFTGLKNQAAVAAEGEELCGMEQRKVPRPHDVVVLGMGSDGHTASLFPNARELASAINSDRICVAITPPDAPHQRMTLTLPAILNSRQIFVHITGDDKRQVLERAMAQGPEEEMPIRWILRQKKVPVAVYWSP